MATTPGLPARRAALHMLEAVLRRGETLEQAEAVALKPVPEGADRGLARAIANETLRWLVDFDALIDGATAKPLPPHAKPRIVLRLMLAQWLRLETPPHAVIATALPLVAQGPRRLVHGVFSALAKAEPLLPPYPTLPAAVAQRWGARAAPISQGLAAPPPLDLTLRDPAETERWAQILSASSLAPGHVRLPRGKPVDTLPGFAEGAWWVQDLAASLPARLLGAGAGRHVLDLCAAPGGKTMQLSAAGWNVTALDISKRRLAVLKDNLQRTGLKAAPVRADALRWEPRHRFDAILLDAPCTATGTCRRHPDVLHRIDTAAIAELVPLQADLLARAETWLKPGGTLIYAVCSLERAEGEDQAAKVTLNPAAIRADELPQSLAPNGEGYLRTHPGLLRDAGGLDGFFIARWRS